MFCAHGIFWLNISITGAYGDPEQGKEILNFASLDPVHVLFIRYSRNRSRFNPAKARFTGVSAKSHLCYVILISPALSYCDFVCYMKVTRFISVV
jgi:hypothetical protein